MARAGARQYLNWQDAGQHDAEQGGELRVPVPDQEPCPAGGVLKVDNQILGGLLDPGGGRCAPAPEIGIRRLACSMTASIYIRARDK